MNEDFIFRLGADVSGFTKSISQVEAELKKVQTELKTKTGAAIIEANKYIVELQGSLKNLREVGLDKLPKAATAGASSLNALGQVARDAPFGFIAIQNNLPILFDQLGTLSSKSGGAIGALKSLGAALIGPAGVTFAIGGAISAITVLVQKYGSFGNALDAIFTKQSAFSKEILDFNKDLAKYNEEKRTSVEITQEEIATTEGAISKIRSLSSIVLDQTRSYNERNSALNALKDINKDYFGNLDLEKTKYEDLETAITTYIRSVRQAAVSKGFESAIGDASVQLAKAVALQAKLQEELETAKRKQPRFVGKADRVDTSEIDAAKEAFDEQTKVVEDLRKEISLYNIELDKSITLQNQIQAPIDAANKALEDKKRKEAEDAKRETERKRRLQERVRAEEKATKDALRIVEERIKRQDFLNKEDNKNLERTIKERRKLEREAGIIIPTTLPTAPSAIPFNADKIKANAKIAETALNNLKKEANFSSALNLMESTFFNPLTDLFENFINTGRFAFKEFAQSVLKAINQIVAKIIATGIIVLLASVLFPGAGGIGATFAKNIGPAISGAIGIGSGFGGGRKVANPSFGGVSGGALQMAGAVNLSLRGSDLVGSINRTNATISRVG
jgi:DNA repair exonuclease SbcCD ATPase subunit